MKPNGFRGKQLSRLGFGTMRIEFMPEDKKPTACIGCGQCTRMCPQNIDIPGALKDFAEKLSELPSWAEICRQREAAARKG